MASKKEVAAEVPVEEEKGPVEESKVEDQPEEMEPSGEPEAEAEVEAEEAPPAEPCDPACRVFVGNLAYSVRAEDLKEFMEQVGKVTHAEVFEFYDGRSKGSGIVEFETPEEAQKAKDTLQDTELSGRKVFLREDREAEKGNFQTSRPRPPQGRGRRGGRGAWGGHMGAGGFNMRGDDPRCLLYVSNLAYSVSWQDLKDHFRDAGFEVARTDILGNDEGYSKGAGTVLLKTPEDAQAAIEQLNGTELCGRVMDVHLDRFAGGGPPPHGRGRGRGRGTN